VAALLSPEDLENHRVAHELVRLKLRLPLVNHLTGIHIKPLRRQWNRIHPNSPPNGRLRESVRAFISDSFSAAELASFVAIYNRLAPDVENHVDPALLLRALTMHERITHRDLDINAAYFAVRDVRAKIVEWRRCGRCQTGFIYSPAAFHMRSCPFCAMLTIVSS
jgi:hypothetical protein